MKRNSLIGLAFSLGLGTVFSASLARALPGQTIEEVTAWIQNHPTLQPARGETLLIRKSDTPARRFTFEALTTLPIRAEQGGGGEIRSEQISLFDRINGVSRQRLEDSLRVIYGAEIYQDFDRARSIYQYPTPEMTSAAENRDAPLLEWIEGEVRQGDRFAYWLELAQTPEGIAYTGQISVFLPEDVEKLVRELQNR